MGDFLTPDQIHELSDRYLQTLEHAQSGTHDDPLNQEDMGVILQTVRELLFHDIPALLLTWDAYMPIVNAVAEMPMYSADGWRYVCPFPVCRAWHDRTLNEMHYSPQEYAWAISHVVQHRSDCPVTQARVLLEKGGQ